MRSWHQNRVRCTIDLFYKCLWKKNGCSWRRWDDPLDTVEGLTCHGREDEEEDYVARFSDYCSKIHPFSLFIQSFLRPNLSLPFTSFLSRVPYPSPANLSSPTTTSFCLGRRNSLLLTLGKKGRERKGKGSGREEWKERGREVRKRKHPTWKSPMWTCEAKFRFWSSWVKCKGLLTFWAI